MSWRTVIITKRAKLDLKMGHLVIRSGDDIQKILVDEISTLIIENNAVSVTGCLLSELAEHKVKVILCDNKRTPVSEMVPYYGSHDTSSKVREQIRWSDDMKACVWTHIVAEKIRKQAEFLTDVKKYREAELLRGYIAEMEFNDKTNREGHAAKVYFNALFGLEFTRSCDCVTNSALNYGYSIILSAFNRECISNGYITQLGLFHNNMFNNFNLSCDLMEPFRVFVDRKIHEMKLTKFETDERHSIINLLNETVLLAGTEQYVNNAIKVYCKSVFDAI